MPKALDLGTTKLNTTIQDIAYVGLYIVVLPMFILHKMQQTGVEEIKACEKHSVFIANLAGRYGK